jgi:hypothetical protein
MDDNLRPELPDGVYCEAHSFLVSMFVDSQCIDSPALSMRTYYDLSHPLFQEQ